MSADAEEPALPPEPEGPWSPSVPLRQQLLWGAFGVAIAGGLASAGHLITIVQGPKPGLTTEDWLSYASSIPQIWVLLAFLGIARETKSDGIRRCAIGFFGAGWLLQISSLAEDVLPLAAAGWMSLAVMVAYVILMGYCFARALAVVGPGAFLGAFILFKLAVRLPKMLPGLKAIDRFTMFMIVLGAIAFLAFIILTIWFGAALIAQRRKLGGSATALGWFKIAAALTLVGGVIWLIAEMVRMADAPGADNLEFEDLMKPQLHAMSIAALTFELLAAGLMAVFFLNVRQRTNDAATYP